jgi:PTH1 family peptidyl-tRNA hydrolase
VLGSFNASEQPLLKDVLDEVLRGLELIQRQGLERAGNRLNGLQLASVEQE